jgi:O-antigen ligase
MVALGTAATVVIAIQLAAIAGWWNVALLGDSATYRIHLWRAAMEACWSWHGLVGHGVGSSVAVLIEQPAYAEAFRAVPSYAEHAHHEVLQALLDGGLVNLGLLTAALVATLKPLWQQRHDHLLAAWAVVIVLALIESHLSQPIALLGLALLAGTSWRHAPSVAVPSPIPFAAAAGLALLLSLRDAVDGGNPPMLEARAHARLDRLRDPAARLAELDRLRARVGPLDWIDLARARELKRLGRLPEAAAALADHRRRCPAAPAAPDSDPARDR